MRAWHGMLAVSDVLAFAVSLGAAWLAGTAAGTDAQQLGAVLVVAAVMTGLVLLGFAARRHYGFGLARPATLDDALASGLAGLAGTGLAAYALQLQAGLLPLLVTWGGAAMLLPLGRSLARAALCRAGRWQRQVLVVGSGAAASRALDLLRDGAGRDWSVAALLNPARVSAASADGWRNVLERHGADLVVLAMDDPPGPLLARLARSRVPFAVLPRLDGTPVLGGAPLRALGQDAMLWSYRDNLRQPAARAAKVAMDVAGALAMLLVLTPVLLVIAALVKRDGGPMLYAHRRIGAGGRSFPCLKFRSMVRDADVVLAEVLRTDPAASAEWAATHKLRHDPRITAIGRILRQTSLDELPQLFNVLRGDMSLVGPRPIVDAEVPRYGDDIHYYHAARPGLTGLWQVSGRSDTGYAQRVHLDAWYVRNWSLRNDIVILFRTLPAVLKRRGAV